MSLDSMKETLYSPDVRKNFLERGYKAADDFLSDLKISESESEKCEKCENNKENTEHICEDDDNKENK